MKATKNIMLMALGGCAVLAYQKYNKPVMKGIKKTLQNSGNKSVDKLEDMM